MDKYDLLEKKKIIEYDLGWHAIKKSQITYLIDYFKKNIQRFLLIVFLLFLFSAVEISLVVVSRSKTIHFFEAIVFFCGICIYFGLIFFYLNKEKAFTLTLENELKKRWMSFLLQERSLKVGEKKKNFIKIISHVGLIQAGIENVVFGSLRELCFILFAFILFIILDISLFVIPALIILAIVSFFFGVFISRVYGIRDISLSNSISESVIDGIFERREIRNNAYESEYIKKLEDLFSLDIMFRARREAIVESLGRVSFVLILILIFLFSAFQTKLAYIFPNDYGTTSIFRIIVIFYVSRILYTAFRIGLFAPILKLGTGIAVPQFNEESVERVKNNSNSFLLTFRTNSTRFFKHSGGYKKNISVELKGGGAVSVVSMSDLDSQFVFDLISGELSDMAGFSWIVIRNNSRMLYNEWKKRYSDVFSIDESEIKCFSVIEFLTGKKGTEISAIDIQRVYEVASSSPLFNFVLLERNLNKEITRISFSVRERRYLGVISAIIRRPSVVMYREIINADEKKGFLDAISVLRNAVPYVSIVEVKTRDSESSFEDIYEIPN